MENEIDLLTSIFEPLYKLVTYYEAEPWSIRRGTMLSVLVPARDHVLSRLYDLGYFTVKLEASTRKKPQPTKPPGPPRTTNGG